MEINGIDFWKLKESLTIHEASSLALGCDPAKVKEVSEPKGWRGCYSALVDAVKSDIDQEFENDREIKELRIEFDQDFDMIDSLIERNKSLIFISNVVKGYDLKYVTDFGPGDIDSAEIKVSAIKKWFDLRGIRPAFFFSEEPEHQTPTRNKNPNYETLLMSIMYATIDRYYGENYMPDERDTVPLQTTVVEWLIGNYSLSKSEAMAIDKMTRPNRSRHPKGES